MKRKKNSGVQHIARHGGSVGGTGVAAAEDGVKADRRVGSRDGRLIHNHLFSLRNLTNCSKSTSCFLS